MYTHGWIGGGGGGGGGQREREWGGCYNRVGEVIIGCVNMKVAVWGRVNGSVNCYIHVGVVTG